jgi:GntR family transcriptional regulator/MocR family aminotransferase
MQLTINLDSQLQSPLHKQLYDEIRKGILSGRLPRGQKMPSSRTLADQLSISRATVTTTYQYLLSEGYLEASVGSGTYVCRKLPEESLKIGPEQRRSSQQRKQVKPSANQLQSWQARNLSAYGRQLLNETWLSSGGEEPEIQFSFGRPDWDNFPQKRWLSLLNKHFREGRQNELDYPGNACGYMPLRQAIVSYLSRARALSCTPEQIIIVNGSQQALDLVARVLVDRGDKVGIEEPGYLGAYKALSVTGGKLTPLQVDAEGLKTDVLPSLGKALKLIYVTPSHQFPTGVALSLPRRLELLAFASRSGTFIVEDDYDSEFRYSGRPMPALAGLDNAQNVIYIGTFSKVLFPALRLGYLVVPPPLAPPFQRAKWLADRHSPLLEQKVLAEFIAQGDLDRHIRRMRKLYARRRLAVLSALKQEFAENVTIFGDNAGINVLVRIKTNRTDADILASADELGVGIMSTAECYLGDPPAGEFLLNYAGLSEEEIGEGIARLKRACR